MAILRRNCPHCPAEHVAFQLLWSDVPPHKPAHIWNCCAICGACGKPICFGAVALNAANRAAPTGFNGDMEDHWKVGKTWPSRNNPTAPPHTPAAVEKRFLEGEDAYNRGNWNAAVAMYRSALDIGTKGMDGVPQKKTFFERLQWLHENHQITPDIKSWADHVRVEGNAALHEPEEFAEGDAKALRFFTEMFLRYVFELPGAVREFRGEEGPAAGS